MGLRSSFKTILRRSRVRVLCTRVTVTRFTLAYFWLTLISFILSCGLQGLLFFDNTQAVQILGEIVRNADVPDHLPMVMHGHIAVCDGLPGDARSTCVNLVNLNYILDIESRDGGGGSIFQLAPSKSEHSTACVYSLSWLTDDLRNSQREDITIIFFSFWMFTMGMMTILNESVPHLFTSFLGHILGGEWAVSRMVSTKSLVELYRNAIVPRVCDGFDPLGSWWELRLMHMIPVAVNSGVAVVGLGLLSMMLLSLYNKASFARVGATPQIHRMYKLVLVFSVGIHVSFFFSIASSVLWIDKILNGNMSLFTTHGPLYLTGFVVVLALELPFLLLGWKSVRKECERRFAVFFVICLVLIGVSSAMFGGLMYRCLFMSWKFFATGTVTSFVFLVLTAGFACICRTNFGKGLAQYLNVSETLEGMNFTPVYFPRLRNDSWDSKISTSSSEYGLGNSDSEKQRQRQRPPESVATPIMRSPPRIGMPMQYLQPRPLLSMVTTAATFNFTHEEPRRYQASQGQPRNNNAHSSVYSDTTADPVLLSSSPPLISELSPPNRHMRRLTKSRVRAEKRSLYGEADWRSQVFFTSSAEGGGESRPGTGDSGQSAWSGEGRAECGGKDSMDTGTTLSLPSKAFLARI